jgi:SWI/SNF-related matrix-associated actin-dependent regulator of chromatin subfamily A member 5
VEDQMLDRIRRKLFLSVKVMGSDSASADSQNSDLKAKELLDILRKGSSALSRSNDDLDLSNFLGASIDKILETSRSRDVVREAKLKTDLGEGEAVDKNLIRNAEEEERALLSGVAQVQSRVFEGRMVERQSNKQIAKAWTELQKRARVDRTVVIDGITVIAAHVGPEVVRPSDSRLRSMLTWTR